MCSDLSSEETPRALILVCDHLPQTTNKSLHYWQSLMGGLTDCIHFLVPIVASSTKHQINHSQKIKDGVHYKRTLKFVTSLKFATTISTPLFH